MKPLRMLAFAGLTLFALSACTEDKNLASKDPATSVKNIAVAIREEDFNRVVHISVPPDVYAKLQAKDKKDTANLPAPTADESKQFTDMVAKYTGSDAEDKLFTQIQPALSQYGPQIPMYVAMGSGAIGQGINSSDKLSADEKTQANAVLTAITKWATTAPLSDPDKAKQAIKVFVQSARDMKFTTLDAAEKLSFEDKVQKVGVGVGGLRKILTVYGLDTDKALDSVTTEKKSETGDNAVVTVSFNLLDTPIKYDVPMVKVDGRWYVKHTLDQVNDVLNAPAPVAAPTAGPAMPPAQAAQPAQPMDPAGPAPSDPTAVPSAANDVAAPADAPPPPAGSPSSGG